MRSWRSFKDGTSSLGSRKGAGTASLPRSPSSARTTPPTIQSIVAKSCYNKVGPDGILVQTLPWTRGFGGSTFDYTFRRDIGLERLRQSGGAPGDNWSSDHELREASFPGAGVAACDPSPRSFTVRAALGQTAERTVTISNPGTRTLKLSAGCSNSHIDVILDQPYVPPNSSTRLHLRYLYAAPMADTARIIVASNAATSPDTILFVVSAGPGTSISLNPSWFSIGQDQAPVSNPVPYDITITNHGPQELLIDSLGSDTKRFSGTQTLKTVAVGASRTSTVAFKPRRLAMWVAIFFSTAIRSRHRTRWGSALDVLGAVPCSNPEPCTSPSAVSIRRMNRVSRCGTTATS